MLRRAPLSSLDPARESLRDDVNSDPTGRRPDVSANGPGIRSLLGSALVLLVAGVILLWPVRRTGLVADDWEILLKLERGWIQVAVEPLSYHFIPVAMVSLKAIGKLVGTSPSGWIAAHLASLAAGALGAFGLAWVLFRDVRIGLLAGCLLLGSAAFHEVTFWPIVGLIFALAGVCYAGALAVGYGLARQAPSPARAIAFAGLAGAAYLAYPGALTVFPIVGLWTVLRVLSDARRPGGSSRKLLASLTLRFLPSVPVIAGITYVRMHFRTELAAASRFDFNFERLRYLAEGIVSTFSLQGSRDVVHRLVTLGTTTDGTSTAARGAAVTVVATAIVLGIRRILHRPRDASSFLVLALVVHFCMMSFWVGIAPRHCYIPSILALILVARLFVHTGERVHAAAGGRAAWPGPAIAALLTSGLILAARGSFLDAARLWELSSRTSARLVELVAEARSVRPSISTVVTIDLPTWFSRDGFTVPFSSYNLPKLLALRRFDLKVDRYRLQPERPLQLWGPNIRSVSHRGALLLARDRRHLVLRFDEGTLGLHRVDSEDSPAPSAITRGRAPELAWRDGSWPWLLISREEPLECEVTATTDSWLAVRYLSGPSTGARLVLDGRREELPATAEASASGWLTRTVALPDGVETTSPDTLLMRFEAETPTPFAGAWPFRPTARYNPQSAPFLGWEGSEPNAFFAVRDELHLPLVIPSETQDSFEVHVRLCIESGRPGELELGERSVSIESTRPGEVRWSVMHLELPKNQKPVLRIRSTGPRPLLVGDIEVCPVGEKTRNADARRDH